MGDKINALIDGLKRELKLRELLYEAKRDELLSFDDVEWKALADISEYSTLKVVDGVDASNYVGVDNLLQNKMGKRASLYAGDLGTVTSYSYGDILIGNIRPYLKKIWFADSEGGASNDVLVIRTKTDAINQKFLYCVLSSDGFFDYAMQHAKGVKMPRGDKSQIMRYDIPIPSLEEQQRVVKELDSLTTNHYNIIESLEVEIKNLQEMLKSI